MPSMAQGSHSTYLDQPWVTEGTGKAKVPWSTRSKDSSVHGPSFYTHLRHSGHVTRPRSHSKSVLPGREPRQVHLTEPTHTAGYLAQNTPLGLPYSLWIFDSLPQHRVRVTKVREGWRSGVQLSYESGTARHCIPDGMNPCDRLTSLWLFPTRIS